MRAANTGDGMCARGQESERMLEVSFIEDERKGEDREYEEHICGERMRHLAAGKGEIWGDWISVPDQGAVSTAAPSSFALFAMSAFCNVALSDDVWMCVHFFF